MNTTLITVVLQIPRQNCWLWFSAHHISKPMLNLLLEKTPWDNESFCLLMHSMNLFPKLNALINYSSEDAIYVECDKKIESVS